MALVGYTWQWRRSCVVTLLMALLEICSDLIFRVKTHGLTFGGWIGRRWRLYAVPLLEASLLENPSRHFYAVKRLLARMVAACISSLGAFSALFFFFSSV